MTSYEILEKIRSNEIKLDDFVNDLCSIAEARETKLKIFASGTFDKTRVMRQARILAEKFPDPGSRPPLYGLPVGVKDIIRVDGFETLCGSKLPPSLFEGVEASSIKRLKDAGAIIFGKTVTAEFAGTEPGPTRNPHNFDRTPGGSSSGSAAGVAAGYFLLALGTQTSGSVIRPAAYCGVVGFKPSLGKIPTDGVIPFSQSTDHVGFFAPDTALIPPVMQVLSGYWKPVSCLPRLGVPKGSYLEKASPNALNQFWKSVRQIEKKGITVKHIAALDDIDTIMGFHRRLVTGEITRVHRRWYAKFSNLYRPRTVGYCEKGKSVTEEELTELRKKQLQLRDRLLELMTRHGIDAWICPAATGTAPRGILSTGDPIMNMPWTNAGLPAVTIPSGSDKLGLPYGLQVVGKFLEDEKAVAIAIELEKCIMSQRDAGRSA